MYVSMKGKKKKIGKLSDDESMNHTIIIRVKLPKPQTLSI